MQTIALLNESTNQMSLPRAELQALIKREVPTILEDAAADAAKLRKECKGCYNPRALYEAVQLERAIKSLSTRLKSEYIHRDGDEQTIVEAANLAAQVYVFSHEGGLLLLAEAANEINERRRLAKAAFDLGYTQQRMQLRKRL